MIPITAVTLIMTENCNFRCKYCFVDFNARAMPWEVVEDIPAWLQEQKSIKQISFFGGEPLLEWNKIKYLLDELGNKYKYTITTNGSILTEEMLVYFKKYGIYINVSYDGIFQEIYRGAPGRRAQNAEIVRENMRRLCEAGVAFGILHQVVPEMVDGLMASVEDALKYSDKVFLNIVLDNYHKWEATEIKKLTKTLDEIRQKYPSVGPMSRFAKWEEPPRRCGAGRGGVAIGIDGQLYPCQRFALAHFYPHGDIWGGIDHVLKEHFEGLTPTRGIAPCFITNKERTGSIFEPPDDLVKIYDRIYDLSRRGIKKNKKPADGLKVGLHGHYGLYINGKKVAEADNTITDCLIKLIQDRFKGNLDNKISHFYILSNYNYTPCSSTRSDCEGVSYDYRVEVSSKNFSASSGKLEVHFDFQNTTGSTITINQIGIGNANGDIFSYITLNNPLQLDNGYHISGTWTLEVSTAGDDGAAKNIIIPLIGQDSRWVRLEYAGLFYADGNEPVVNSYKRAKATGYSVDTLDDYHTKIKARYSFSRKFKGKFKYLKLFIDDRDSGFYENAAVYTYDLDPAGNYPNGIIKLDTDQWDFYVELSFNFVCDNQENCAATCENSCQTSEETTCTDTCETSCQDTCESSCQTSCENNCQSGCEASCQDACMVSCQTDTEAV